MRTQRHTRHQVQTQLRRVYKRHFQSEWLGLLFRWSSSNQFCAACLCRGWVKWVYTKMHLYANCMGLEATFCRQICAHKLLCWLKLASFPGLPHLQLFVFHTSSFWSLRKRSKAGGVEGLGTRLGWSRNHATPMFLETSALRLVDY